MPLLWIAMLAAPSLCPLCLMQKAPPASISSAHTHFLPGHLRSQIPTHFLYHVSHHGFLVSDSRQCKQHEAVPYFILPAPIRGPPMPTPTSPPAWMSPPCQLIQNVLNSSQERILAVCALARGSPILLVETQDLPFWCTPKTVSMVPTVSWGPEHKATWPSL